MLIRMLTGIAGRGFALDAGDEHDFPADEAVRLIKSGAAVPVEAAPVERAVMTSPPERRGRGRRSEAA